MAFWKRVLGGDRDKPADEQNRTVGAESRPTSENVSAIKFLSLPDVGEASLPPVSSVAGVCCFVGSNTFRLSESDATKAYLLKNPNWPGTFAIAVFHASKPLREGMGPEQACTLACLDNLGEQGLLKNRVIVAQTVLIRNASAPSERIPICFATVFGQSEKTNVILLEEDSIPY